MGSLCGSSGTQQVTQTQTIPPYIEDQSKANIGLANQVAAGKWPSELGTYTPYSGTRVAGLSPSEQAAGSMIQAGTANPMLGSAVDATYAAMAPTGGMRYGSASPAYAPAGGSSFGPSDMATGMIAGGAQPYSGTFGPSGQLVSQINAAGGGISPDITRMIAASAQRADPGIIAQEMNPYEDSILGAIRRQGDIANNAIRARAAKAGAFGGDREAVMEAAQNEGTQRNIGLAQADIFDKAMAQFNTEQNRGLNVGTTLAGVASGDRSAAASTAALLASLNQAAQQSQAGQFNADRTASTNTGQILSALGLQTQGMEADQANKDRAMLMAGGQQLAGYGETARTGTQQDIANLLGFGNLERGVQQQGLDTAYNDWKTAQDYPLRQLGIRQSAVTGAPYPASNTTTSPAPSVLGQLLGGGAALAGIGGPNGFGLWGKGTTGMSDLTSWLGSLFGSSAGGGSAGLA